jgi:hypothetical protein
MKNGGIVTRRAFLGASAVASAAFLPSNPGFKGEARGAAAGSKPKSNFGGVKIGAITYSFKEVPGNVDALIQACNDAGVSFIELQGSNYGVEEYLGAPKNPRASAAPAGSMPAMTVYTQPGARRASDTAAATSMPGPGQQPQEPESRGPQGAGGRGPQQQTSEETAYNESLKKWRLSVPMAKYEDLGKKFKNAGIEVHILQLGGFNMSDDETEYSTIMFLKLAAFQPQLNCREQPCGLRRAESH